MIKEDIWNRMFRITDDGNWMYVCPNCGGDAMIVDGIEANAIYHSRHEVRYVCAACAPKR